ncbi:hypothetical protein FB451DRAFT_1178347 [Mycena latifolia]|nr:hypothetical protein FB451DRAFT_1178347 [Mycena latifolia]
MSRRLQQASSRSLLDSGVLNQSLLLLGQLGEAGNLAVLKGACLAGRESICVYVENVGALQDLREWFICGSCLFIIRGARSRTFAPCRVLDICQTASSNKVEAMALAEDVGHLAMTVAGQVEEHKDEISADTELLDQISKLCLELEAVHSTLKNLFKRGSRAWFVKHSKDEVKLQRLQRDIKHAIDLFSFGPAIVPTSSISSSNRRMTAGPVLPRMPRNIFGREQTIDVAVTTLIAPAPGRVAILGAAGIGKTSVASMVLFNPRVVECFSTHRYFIACDAAGGKDDLLTSIAGPLGLQGDELQKKLVDALGDPKHRKIIVLDNFESPWESTESSKKEVESLLASLCALDNLAVVITMRGSERPAGVQWSRPFLPQLGPLDVPSARKAFLALSDCLEDDPYIDPLLTAIDCLPLAVALMANLTETDSTETLLLRWNEEHSSLLHRTPDRRSSLDISIGISLNSPRMKAVPESDTTHRMSMLTYYMGLAGLSSDLGGPHGKNIVKRLTPEIGNLHSIVNLTLDSTGESSTIQPLLGGGITAAINLSKFIRYTYLGNPETVRLASVAANRLGDPILRANVLYHLAWVTFTLARGGENLEPERLCKEAIALYEQSGNINGRAECTWLMGQICKGTKQQKTCKALFEQALALAVEGQNTYCQAKCLSCLSEMAFYSGDPKTSELLSEQALPLFRELQHLTNFSLLVQSKSQVGMTLYWLGRLADSRNFDRTAADARFDEAVKVLEQAGTYHQVGRILIAKGDSAIMRCEFYAAREEYMKAIAIYEETGGLQLGFAHLSLGTTAAYLYDYSESSHRLDMAWRTFDKSPNGGYGKLHCDIIYGDLALYRERFGEAATFYQRALLAAEQLGQAEEVGQCQLKLGTVEMSRARLRAGVQHLIVAAAVQRRISDIQGLSQTLVRLGQYFAAVDDTERALLMFRAVYPVCRKVESLRDLGDCLVGMGMMCGDAGAVAEGVALYDHTGDVKGRERGNNRYVSDEPSTSSSSCARRGSTAHIPLTGASNQDVESWNGGNTEYSAVIFRSRIQLVPPNRRHPGSAPNRARRKRAAHAQGQGRAEEDVHLEKGLAPAAQGLTSLDSPTPGTHASKRQVFCLLHPTQAFASRAAEGIDHCPIWTPDCRNRAGTSGGFRGAPFTFGVKIFGEIDTLSGIGRSSCRLGWGGGGSRASVGAEGKEDEREPRKLWPEIRLPRRRRAARGRRGELEKVKSQRVLGHAEDKRSGARVPLCCVARTQSRLPPRRTVAKRRRSGGRGPRRCTREKYYYTVLQLEFIASLVSFSPSSPSKVSLSLFWSFATVVYTLFAALSPVVDGTVSALMATSFSATATVRVILTPSLCILSNGTIHHPFIAALSYLVLISVILLPILYQKGFFALASFAFSSNTGPPTPDPPVPDPGATSSRAPHPDPRGGKHIAAGGAPPPPPPGNETASDAAGRRKKPFGLFAWIWWILVQFFRLIMAPFKLVWWTGAQIICLVKIMAKVLFKIVWLFVGPLFWLTFQYTILPVVALKIIKECGLTSAVVSFSGPVVFKGLKFIANRGRATQFTALVSIWCCVYPFIAVGWTLFVQLAGFCFAVLDTSLRFSWWCDVQTSRLCAKAFRRCLKASRRSWCLASTIAIVGVVIFIALERAPALLTTLNVPLSVRLCYYHQVTAPYYRFIRVPLELWYQDKVRPYYALPSILLDSHQGALCDTRLVSEIVRVFRHMRFCWDWVGAPTLGMLSRQEIYYIFMPPSLYVVTDYIICPVRRLRAANMQLEKRLEALESRSIYPLLFFFPSVRESANRALDGLTLRPVEGVKAMSTMGTKMDRESGTSETEGYARGVSSTGTRRRYPILMLAIDIAGVPWAVSRRSSVVRGPTAGGTPFFLLRRRGF